MFIAFILALASAVAWANDVYYSTTPVVLSSAPVLAPMEEPYVCPLGAGKCKSVSRFGTRAMGKDGKEPHIGVDLAVKPGQLVRAARSGKVIFAGFSKEYVSRANKKEQHRLVIIRHIDGQSSRYVHLGDLRVQPMREVHAGDPVGAASSSDEVGAPVLHFEIREANGAPVDPMPLLKERTKG